MTTPYKNRFNYTDVMTDEDKEAFIERYLKYSEILIFTSEFQKPCRYCHTASFDDEYGRCVNCGAQRGR